uniref:Cytochrome P450 2F2-like n=1 Tax=Panthera tigris altaica TaxID=74533 RepID=A0A8C9KE64_PANTA
MGTPGSEVRERWGRGSGVEEAVKSPDRDPLSTSSAQLSGRWGPVFTVRLGRRPAVVLCGYSALRDALVLQADAFSGRGATAVLERFTRGNGIVFSNRRRWLTLRNLALGALKEFRLGARTIEERILEEADCLLGEFQATIGAPFDPRRLLDNAVSNVICLVVFGNRYGYEDPEFLRLLDLFNDNFRIMSSRWGEMYNIFPSLLDWLPGPHHRIFQNFTELQVFISEQIQQHQQTRQPGEPRDFIDCFLDQMEKEQKDPESHFQEMLVMTTHLFFGGTETTSTTLRYGLLILLKYPEVAVVGRTRTPRLEDRKRLPCTNACCTRSSASSACCRWGCHAPSPGTPTCVATFCPRTPPHSRTQTASTPPTSWTRASSRAEMPSCPLPQASECVWVQAWPGPRPSSSSPPSCRSPTSIDLTPQYAGLGNIPPAFQLRLVAR